MEQMSSPRRIALWEHADHTLSKEVLCHHHWMPWLQGLGGEEMVEAAIGFPWEIVPEALAKLPKNVFLDAQLHCSTGGSEINFD